MEVVSLFFRLGRHNRTLLGRIFFWGAMVFVLFSTREGGAYFASRLSLSTGEEYNDNIFFSPQKTYDFVTVITPTLSFLHQRGGQNGPIWTADLNASGEIFARHSELDNFGDRLTAHTDYFYPYSSRLAVRMTDCLEKRGATRLGAYAAGGLASFGGFGRIATQGGFSDTALGGCGRYGDIGSMSMQTNQATSARTINVFGTGATLDNRVTMRSDFQYSPTLMFGATYGWRYIAFFDEGGRESDHNIMLGGTYTRWRQHNIYARYSLDFIQSRDGSNNTVNNIDVGDDFFSSRQIQLTPTFILFASNGISLKGGGGGNKFGVVHRFDVAVAKLWKTALLGGGVRRGLTGSYGVAGISYTTSFYGYFHIYLSRRLLGIAAVDFSLYEPDTAHDNFKTYQAIAGLQYWLTSWLSANLAYNYRKFEPDSSSPGSNLLPQLKANGNSVFITLAAYFDLWPNVALARGMATSQLLPPAVPGATASPSTTAAPTSSTPQGGITTP